MQSVLVAYASEKGSSGEIAEVMGKTLQSTGFAVTVAPVQEITNLEPYDAIVLGSPIYKGLVLPQMIGFLHKRSKQFAQKPIFFWITCIRILEPDGEEHALLHYLPHDQLNRMNLIETRVFAGKLQFSKEDLDERWALMLHYDGHKHTSELNTDFRDWPTIKKWVEHIATTLAEK